MNDTHMVRHFLAALAYRFQNAVKDAPEGFADLNVGRGVRSPLALVHHINGVLAHARSVLADDAVNRPAELDWQGEVRQVHATLQAVDAVLTAKDIATERLERVLQGPLADAMTHVGQLALLRRLADAPVHAENFYKADIRVGQVGEV